ncbi:sensor domain-containing diguanylate cyclase [Piscinibacter sp.]|jgi:diguanylate cyclase (GGDEF)-like protein|uniref:GGDEF domain-containing protein n=1 Tax=Piscinibacter sp. TaxID=1903157 RepID=UPI00355AA53B
MQTGHVPTLRSRLVWLVTASVVPISVVALALIWHNYQRERSRLVRDSIATARVMISTIDKALASEQAALQVLATSPHLRNNDFSAFYGQAVEVLQHRVADNIVLLDATGQQLINTLLPYGAALPAHMPAPLRDVFQTGRPMVTDLFVGPVTGRPLISVAVPVQRDGSVVYVLGTGISARRLTPVLLRQQLPPGWIGTVFDGSGNIVARSLDAERWVAHPGPPALVRTMAEMAEGALETDSLDGVPVISVFSRSAVSNWTLAVGVPRAHLSDELWRSIAWLLLATGVVLLLSLGLAWLIGGHIARSIRVLAEPALALGFGKPVTLPRFELKETDEVAAALMKASDMLQRVQYEAQHDPLTGLANRPLLGEIVNQQLSVCQRSGSQLALLYVDIDDFKSVNDRHGHAAGDELLRGVATRLKAGIRGSDVAARLGGDEFAALLLDVDRAAAVAVAAKLVDSLSAPYPLDDSIVEISVSVGVAQHPDAGDSCEVLLRRADEAMYRAKSAGKHRYAVAGEAA